MTTLPRRLVLVARDIKLSHSVFALPFALLATFLAAGSAGRLPGAATLALIVLCMVLARTVAMTVNRWADASFDAANPRTAKRAIPRGDLSGQFMLRTAIACALGFLVATSGFWLLDDNPWPMLLAPLVLAYLAAYSFTKRVTSLCHLFLGGALSISPLAAVIAVRPAYLARPEPYLLVVLVLCWVAGFDIIYALQDVGFDRQRGLFSLPARLGTGPALWVSRLLHALVVVAVALLAWLSPQLGAGFALAGVLTAVLLVLEHTLVWGSRLEGVRVAFFNVNGLISLLLGVGGIVDVVRRLSL